MQKVGNWKACIDDDHGQNRCSTIPEPKCTVEMPNPTGDRYGSGETLAQSLLTIS